MEVVSYKHFLHLAKKGTKLSVLEKILLVGLVLLFATVGTISAYYYYLYQKQAPIRTQNQFLNVAESGFGQTKSALAELFASFQVAGVKIQKIEDLTASPNQESGFFISLADIEKILSQIELVAKNIQISKQTLENINVPPAFSDLNAQILNFYADSLKLLDQIRYDHYFTKQMLLATGPSLYLPTLSKDGLWESQDTDEIIRFYKETKNKANITLANLAKLTPPADFDNYYQAQIAYLELLVKVSDSIINTLSVRQEDQEITPLEKAYQILVSATRENEALSAKIATEKLRLFDTKKNLDRFAQITISQNSISAQLAETIANQPQIKSIKMPNFLRGRQIPMLF